MHVSTTRFFAFILLYLPVCSDAFPGDWSNATALLFQDDELGKLDPRRYARLHSGLDKPPCESHGGTSAPCLSRKHGGSSWNAAEVRADADQAGQGKRGHEKKSHAADGGSAKQVEDSVVAVPGTIWETTKRLPWRNIILCLGLAFFGAPALGAAAVLASVYLEVRRNEGAGGAREVFSSSEQGQLVASPYCGIKEEKPLMTSLILQLLRLFRVCVPTVFSTQGLFLLQALLLALLDGLLECLVPSLIVRPLWNMVRRNQLHEFQAFAIFMMAYNLSISAAKATANYFAMRAMIACRSELIVRLHTSYMSRHGRLYYTLSNLDRRVDTPDARITNDTDLLFQFLFEFVFGGILKPEAGLCSQVFFLTATLGVAHFETESEAPGWGLYAIGIALAVVVVSLLPTMLATKRLTAAQADVQSAEAGHRAAHAKCRLFAESVCFYAGEATEAQQIDSRFAQVCRAFRHFAYYKLFVELIQLTFYFGLAPIATIISAFIVRQSPWNDESETTFYVLNLTFVRVIRCCMEVSKNIVDLAKAQAMLQRVIQLMEVMDAFLAFDESTQSSEELCCLTYYNARPLNTGEVVRQRDAPGIVFEHVDVYTPDGLRLLLTNVSLRLDPGESCLVMGPSGIGKSSLLRVLGGLWPLFRTPGPGGHRADFGRPGPLNVFFLAQRPYLFEGTLREQLAYPLWDESLLMDLDNDCMERLFKEANLIDVWEARKDELDTTGISWEDVLSLGEQQRLQFCRLFWHAEWHMRHRRDEQGFFAVLDESSASMDTKSEMLVYQACLDRRLGFLSVAHRPTVIQFHTKVLHFEFDEHHELRHRIRDAKEMALESARLIDDECSNNAELRPHNIRRSTSQKDLFSLAFGRSSSLNAFATRPVSTGNLFAQSKRSGSKDSSASHSGLLQCEGSQPEISRSVSAMSSLATSKLPRNMSRSGLSKLPRTGLGGLLGSTTSMTNLVESGLAPTQEADEPPEEDSLNEVSDEDEFEMDDLEDEGPLVLSPYAPVPTGNETNVGTLGSLWRIVTICQRQGLWLFAIIALNLLTAGMLAFWSVIFMNLKSIMQPEQSANFKAFGHDLGIVITYEQMLPIVLIWGPLQGSIKAVANYMTVLLMIDWRTHLHTRLQNMYLSKSGRLYYILNNLDMRVDSADQRITNDVDLLMQFSFEFFFGGVMKPDSGVLFKGSVFLVSCIIVWADVERISPGQGGLAPGLAFLLFTGAFVLIERLGRSCGEAQAKLQADEAAFRAAHARCLSFAEGISFYGGEETEKALLDGHFQPVRDSFVVFAKRKFPMEVLQLLFFQGQYTIAMLLGGAVAFKEPETSRRTMIFDLTNSSMVSCLQALNKITCQLMDFAKARALSMRVSELYEVMEAFLLFDYQTRRTEVRDAFASGEESPPPRPSEEVSLIVTGEERLGCCCKYQVMKLPCGDLVPVEQSTGVVFEHVDVYTPDGLRLLLGDVTLRLEPRDRCLIMGPSGIGKSSLLRVLGQLWPLFRSPGLAGKRARFSRPGPHNVFFLAQRPYLFEGTLREQVAYPNWSQSLIDELDDGCMERLFKEANLGDVWKAHKHELDVAGISWADVLSLGEQQRLQFCRLFWHHEWVKKHGDHSQGFFAVLDESSASMDTTSEMTVYSACRERRMGILSVAHRPTVIQFHSKVLHFEFDEFHELRHRVRHAKAMAQETAHLLTKHLGDVTRDGDERGNKHGDSPPVSPVCLGRRSRRRSRAGSGLLGAVGGAAGGAAGGGASPGRAAQGLAAGGLPGQTSEEQRRQPEDLEPFAPL